MVLLRFGKIIWNIAPGSLCVSLVCIVLDSLLPAVRLLVVAELVDQAHVGLNSGEFGFRSVAMWCLLLFAAQTAQPILRATRMHTRANLREKLEWQLEEGVLCKSGDVALERFEQPHFFDRVQRALMAGHFRGVRLLDSLFSVVGGSVILFSFSAMLLSAHFLVPIILFAGAAPVLVSYIRRGRESFQLFNDQMPHSRRAEYLVDLLTNRETAKEIRLYGLREHLTKTWCGLIQSLRTARMELVHKQQRHLTLARLSALFAFSLTLLILLGQTLSSVLTLGAFFALTEAARSFQDHLRQLLQSISEIFEGVLYLDDLESFRDSQESPQSKKKRAISAAPVTVSCQNVCFAYPGGEEVLRNVTFDISPNEKLALVGENGAGKSTLIKVLMGLYMPTTGRICINGEDIRNIDSRSLRQCFAAVFQDFLQYQMLAQENIGLGQVEDIEDLERIHHVADRTGAAAIVEKLPFGYRTQLGRYFDGGHDLSRGQWQKFAIARSYFRKARVLVFDEPTAALDARAETALFNQFHFLTEDKSGIFVSHRMASARLADRILVLEGGRLVESGRHDELLSRGGEYATMFSLQARSYD